MSKWRLSIRPRLPRSETLRDKIFLPWARWASWMSNCHWPGPSSQNKIADLQTKEKRRNLQAVPAKEVPTVIYYQQLYHL